MSIKEIIEDMRKQLDFIHENDGKIDQKSFGYVEGVLITCEEAEYIIQKLNEQQVTKKISEQNRFDVLSFKIINLFSCKNPLTTIADFNDEIGRAHV